MELKPRIGIDRLKFGMSQAEIQGIIGEPDKSFINQDDSNQIIWEYNRNRIRLTFYADEKNRFGYFRCRSNDLTFQGKKLIDMDINQAMNGLGNTDKFQVEEYGFFRTYFDESDWLTLNEEYGLVSEVEMGVPFKNDDDYDWPR